MMSQGLRYLGMDTAHGQIGQKCMSQDMKIGVAPLFVHIAHSRSQRLSGLLAACSSRTASTSETPVMTVISSQDIDPSSTAVEALNTKCFTYHLVF